MGKTIFYTTLHRWVAWCPPAVSCTLVTRSLLGGEVTTESFFGAFAGTIVGAVCYGLVQYWRGFRHGSASQTQSSTSEPTRAPQG